MQGYGRINLSTSGCLHFVDDTEVEEFLEESLAKLKTSEMRIVYINYKEIFREKKTLIDELGVRASLLNAPYKHNQWASFIDDLITASQMLKGLVIIINSADLLFRENRREATDIIEAFLVPLHHWLVKAKPYHLCFQMSDNFELQRITS
jgi:hypothetical protein